MKKKPTKADKAFIEKIQSLTFGTGAKSSSDKPPSWVPKVVGPDGKEMQCVFAGKVCLNRQPTKPSDNDDHSFAA